MTSHAESPPDTLSVMRMGMVWTPSQFDRNRVRKELSWISQNRGGDNHGDFHESSSDDIDADDEEDDNQFEHYVMIITPQKWVKDEYKDEVIEWAQREKKFVIMITNKFIFPELWLSPNNLDAMDRSAQLATEVCVISQRHISWNTHLEAKAAKIVIAWALIYGMNIDDMIPFIAAFSAAPRLSMHTFSPIDNQRIGVGKSVDFWDGGLTRQFETPWPMTITWADKSNPYYIWCKLAEAGDPVQSVYKSMITAEITTCSINNLRAAQRIARDKEIEEMNIDKKIKERKQLKSIAMQRARHDDKYKKYFLEISDNLQDWEIELPEGKDPQSFYEKDLYLSIKRLREIQFTSFDPYVGGDPLDTKQDFLQVIQDPSFPKVQREIERELYMYQGGKEWEQWRPGQDKKIISRKMVRDTCWCLPLPFVRAVYKFNAMEDIDPTQMIKLKSNKDLGKYPVDLISRRYVPEEEALFDPYETTLDLAFMAFRNKADGLSPEEYRDSEKDLVHTDIFSGSTDFDFVVNDIWDDQVRGLTYPNIEDSEDLYLYYKFGRDWEKVMEHKKQLIMKKQEGIKDTRDKPPMSIDDAAAQMNTLDID